MNKIINYNLNSSKYISKYEITSLGWQVPMILPLTNTEQVVELLKAKPISAFFPSPTPLTTQPIIATVI